MPDTSKMSAEEYAAHTGKMSYPAGHQSQYETAMKVKEALLLSGGDYGKIIETISSKPIGRCERCGWPLYENVADGCVTGNCSQRPLPPKSQGESMSEPSQFTRRAGQYGWVIEMQGPAYLSARHCGGYEFIWTDDHYKAIRFCTREQADLVMMAVRQLRGDLFPSCLTQVPCAVEHCWVEGKS